MERPPPQYKVPGHEADNDTAMIRRKGEITRGSANGRTCRPQVLGLKNSELVRSVAASLSAAQLTYALRRDDLRFVVFCFAKPEAQRRSASNSVGSYPQLTAR